MAVWYRSPRATLANVTSDREIAAASARAFEQYMLRPPQWKPHPHQVPPDGDWYGWLLLAGRGAGKTDACSNYVEQHVKGPPCLGGAVPHWISIIAPTLGDAVTACYSGPSGIRAHSPDAKMVQSAGGTIVRWPNGSQAKMFGAQSPEDVERLRAGGNSCLVAGTLVKTVRGDVPIQDVTVGDRVWTRRGLRRVRFSGRTRDATPIWRLTTTTGRVVEGTADHEVLTARGWIQLAFLTPDDTLTTWCEDSSSTTVSAGTSATTVISPTHDVDCFTGTSTRRRTSRYPTATTFTTSITIDRTTMSTTSSFFDRQSTLDFIPDVTSVRRTHALAGRRGRIDNRVPSGARGVVVASSRARYVEPATTVDPATTSVIDTVRFPVAHSRDGCARCAVMSSTLPSVEPRRRAVDRVLRCEPTERVEPVYDLMIEHDHEFYANGVVVANCLVWMEEMAAWRYLQQCYEQVRFGLRSGVRPHWIASTTPKPRPLIKKLAKETPRNVVITRASTDDNPFLEEHVREALYEEYGGLQIGRQELYAEILDEDKNALWRRAALDKYRVNDAPELRKISVGVDPSGGAGEQGIVVVGKSLRQYIEDGKLKTRVEGYVLDDRTVTESPAGWGRAAVRAAVDWEADDIVVETNFGGDMASSTIAGAAEALGVTIPVRTTRASRGKRVRAEPVAALSERGYWHHVGVFEELEDQLVTWTEELKFSPDRLDAMVWPAWHQRLVSARLRGEAKFGGSTAQLRIVG